MTFSFDLEIINRLAEKFPSLKFYLEGKLDWKEVEPFKGQLFVEGLTEYELLILKGENPFSKVYPHELTEREIETLIFLKEKIRRMSNDLNLITAASDRNKHIMNPLTYGSLVHGVIRYTPELLKSILNNGVLCSEFLGMKEDGETFFHADFIESNKGSVPEWQNEINNASSKLINGKLPIFRRLRNFMASCTANTKIITLIVNRSNSISWTENQESRLNSLKSRFIVSIPIDYTKEGPNQVSILGGVASTDIYGIIISKKVDHQEITLNLNEKEFYIPIFDCNGNKVY